MIQEATIRQLEIIGEAANMLSVETRQISPEIPWREIVDMRHKLIHGYQHISLPTVWETTHDDLPEMRENIESLLDRTMRT